MKTACIYFHLERVQTEFCKEYTNEIQIIRGRKQNQRKTIFNMRIYVWFL